MIQKGFDLLTSGQEHWTRKNYEIFIGQPALINIIILWYGLNKIIK